LIEPAPTLRRLAILALCAAIGSGLAACGSSKKESGGGGQQQGSPAEPSGQSTEAAKPKDLDACELIPREELQEAVGETFPGSEGMSEGAGSSTCRYQGEEASGLSAVVNVIGQGGKQALATSKAAVSEPQPVENLGDEAFFSEGGQTMGAVKGDKYLEITYGGDLENAEEKLRPVIQKALGKL
jgi:hypothetical protein